MLTTIDSQPTCDIVDARKRLYNLTLWDSAVDEVAQNLANCIQKTFNYLVKIEPADCTDPVKHRYRDPVHKFHWSLLADVSLSQSCTHLSSALLTAGHMQERVHLELPRAIIPEQQLGKERWGPWRVDVEALTAILSLWTYNFKKAFHSLHRNGEFVFVIGSSGRYHDVYREWISRYNPDNPVYITRNMMRCAGNSDDLHLVEYVGQGLPFSDVVIAREPKSRHPKIEDEQRESEDTVEYIGYQYKSHAKRYTSLVKE